MWEAQQKKNRKEISIDCDVCATALDAYNDVSYTFSSYSFAQHFINIRWIDSDQFEQCAIGTFQNNTYADDTRIIQIESIQNQNIK